jgi:hypothetical protein
MIYRECGHVIKPCDVGRAPKCVREKDMPKKCLACRGGARLEGELRLRERRKLGEERSRPSLGAKIHLPWGLGGRRTAVQGGVDWNVDEFRRDWRAEIDAIFGNIEPDRRDRW